MSDDHYSTVTAQDAKTHFAELLERVAGGDEVAITRHGAPVARLVPVRPKSTPAQRRAAIKRWRQLSKGLSLGGLRIKDLIREGRR